MNPRTERRLVDGPAGRIEVAIDAPTGTPAGVAFIGHPHPLYGGTLDNKVAATVARAFVALHWIAVRPNFRGVGASEGAHDHGSGETEDFLFLIESAPQWLHKDPAMATLPRALAGFSFGSFVAAQAAAKLVQRQYSFQHLILIGAAAGKWPMPAVPAATFVIHGEFDETIPLAHVLEWARPQDLPVVVMPGADHFFHRRLSTLKRLVTEHVQAHRAHDAAH